MEFVLVVIVPRQIGRGTACAGADMRCRDSSGCGLECYGEEAVLGFINLLPRLKQLVDQFMKSNLLFSLTGLFDQLERFVHGLVLGDLVFGDGSVDVFFISVIHPKSFIGYTAGDSGGRQAVPQYITE